MTREQVYKEQIEKILPKKKELHGFLDTAPLWHIWEDHENIAYNKAIDDCRNALLQGKDECPEDFKTWALEQFENIKGCHMDCDCTDGEHQMFHIADDAIDAIRRGKWSGTGLKTPEKCEIEPKFLYGIPIKIQERLTRTQRADKDTDEIWEILDLYAKLFDKIEDAVNKLSGKDI